MRLLYANPSIKAIQQDPTTKLTAVRRPGVVKYVPVKIAFSRFKIAVFLFSLFTLIEKNLFNFK